EAVVRNWGNRGGEVFVFDERQTQERGRSEEYRGVDALKVHIFETLHRIHHSRRRLRAAVSRRADEAATFSHRLGSQSAINHDKAKPTVVFHLSWGAIAIGRLK